MAEKNPSRGTNACLMCLEQPDALKILPNCKHVFCCKCLTDYLEKQSPGTKGSFPCPTCQTKCPLPGGDVQRLVDYVSGDEANRGGEEKQTTKQGGSSGMPCRICLFSKDKKVDAENLCEECSCLYLCQGCTEVHAQNKATSCHVLISLKKRGKGNCKVHKDLITCYCTSCAEPCCQVCVFLDHGDHNISRIGEVFHSVVDEIKTLTGEQERRSADLKKFEPQLRFLEGTEMTGRRDILIKETEDHAEKFMDHIIQEKERTVQQIKDDHQSVTDVLQCLEQIPNLGTLDAAVVKAQDMVTKAEVHPEDIEKLSDVKNVILDCRIKSELEVETFWERYKNFHDSPIYFTPNPPTAIGILQPKPRVDNTWNMNPDTFKSVFEKTMTVDNQAKFIPCVANLGNDFYAVAHPVLASNKSEAVDIYKFPGELQRTFRDHVSPVYDMVATFTGQLAILSTGTTPDTCSVRFFDPEAGYDRTSPDLPVRNPLSFDINIRGQYVLLNNDGGYKIYFVNEDATVDLTHAINDGSITAPSRIACSGLHYYLSGTYEVLSIYKRQGKQLVRVGGSPGVSYLLKGISVTHFDRIMMCWSHGNASPYLSRYTWVCNQLSSRSSAQIVQGGLMTNGANLEMRLAIKDDCNYTVWSQGYTIRVYEG